VSPTWELISQRPGGSVSTLAVGGAGVLALTTAALHRSVDTGLTWSTLTAATLPPPLNALAACGHSLFVGGPSGLARSRDLGQSWTPVLTDARVVCLGVTLEADRTTLLAGTQTDGLLRSENDGATWASANAGLSDPTIVCLGSTPAGLSFAGTSTGMFRSSNAGRSWREVDLPCGPISVECLAASADVILVGTDAAGSFVSRDTGRTWSPVSGLTESGVTALGVSGGLVAVGSSTGAYVSHDGGETWRFDAIGTVLSVVCLADCLLAGVAGEGVMRLEIAGNSWQPSSAGLHGRVTVDLGYCAPAEAFLVADLENHLHRSTDAGRSWQPILNGPFAASSLATGCGVVYAATTTGLDVSHDAGLTWSTLRSDAAALAVAATPSDTALAAFADGQLMVFSDSWRVCLDWDSARGRVVDVALADEQDLFVAAVGERSFVWRSRDGGQHWSAWFSADRVESLCFAISPDFAIDEQVLVGAGARIYRQRSGAWLSSEIEEVVLRIAFGATPGTVYGATSRGVQRSLDNAKHFTPWSDGLTRDTPVLALQSTPQAVYALGFGGTLWRAA
jgi:photosystem II stability/assembly factor-like uncharacterized protein